MHRTRIFLLEADPFRTPGLGRHLVQLGADLIASTTRQQEALDLCRQLGPEIVLVDLPPIADPATANVIRAIRETLGLPVVILAATDRLPGATWMAQARPSAYAFKPCDARRLEFALAVARAQHAGSASTPAVEPRFQHLAKAVEQSPAAIVITNRDGRIEYVNPAFERVTGYSSAEAVGQNPRVLKSGLLNPDFYRDLWATLLRGETWSGEFHNRRRDGTLFWEHASISPMRNAEGEVTHFVAVKEDITAQKTAQLELVRARDDAEAASRAKSSFLAAMSHELRTPLNAIIGVTTTLLAESEAPALREALTLNLQSGQHLLSLIEELLEFSSLQAGKSPLEPAPFELAPVLEEVLRQVAELPGGRNLALTLTLDPAIPARLRGDQRRLRQVLLNLLANAVKFTPAGAVHLLVRPSGRAAAPQLRFAVVDTGIGIDAAGCQAIFQPFTQANDSIKQRFGGTGLGLAISRAYVGQMGGVLKVRSRPGRGSVFYFSIPCEAIDAPAAAMPSIEARRAARRRPVSVLRSIAPVATPAAIAAPAVAPLAPEIPLAILAADDVPTNRFVFRMVLKHLGYDCTLVGDGREVLAALAQRPYDLVLLDVQMPVMDGHAAAREICRLYPDPARRPKLVAVTADTTQGSREACLASGMDAFLTKPLVGRALADCIRQLFAPAANAESVPSPSWLNREYLDHFAPGESPEMRLTLLRHLRELAGADCRQMQPVLESACAAHDVAQLRTTLHGLKGCFETLGWERAANLCECALREARAGTFARWESFPGAMLECVSTSDHVLDEYLNPTPTHHAV